MSVFQSFQTGLAIGQEQRKERDRTAAQSSAADLFKIGNYEGAESALIGIGDYQGADAYASAGKRRKDAEQRKAYGQAFKTGGATGLRDAAGANADFDMYGMAQGIDDSNVMRERQTKTWEREDYQQGLGYLAQSAASLKGHPIEDRGALALQALEQTPFAQDPQVRAAIERAAADGRITDEELDAFEQQMLSAAERMTQENTDRQFDYNAGQDVQAQSNWEREAGKYGVTPVFGRDANGNRVLLQTSNAGGVDLANLPEGVTLEDDYSKAFDRTSGTEAAKKAAYEGAAGQAIIAFENKSNELLGQIDTAMGQTNWANTGFLGRMVAAGDLDGTLDAIGAKAMLSELIAIKAQGGTLGALSDAEGKALRDAAVNVSRSQSEKQLDANLRAYRLQVEKTRDTMKRAFEDEYVNKSSGRFPSPRSGGPTPPAGAAQDMSDDDLKAALGIQ